MMKNGDVGIFPVYYSCSKHSRRFAGLEACFLLVAIGFFLFLFDKFRLKHLLKHANKKKIARIAAVYQKLVRQLCSDFS